MADSKTISVRTPKFRVSFPNVFRPKRNDLNGKDEFSLVMLFPKGADLSALKAAAQAAAKEKWGDKIPSGLRSPFRDQGEKEYEGYEDGAVFVTAKSTVAPGVVGSKADPLTGKLEVLDDTTFYPGCYAHAMVRAYAYEQKGNKGVAFGLGNIQKLADGEPLGGRVAPEADFEPVAGVETAEDGGKPADASALFSLGRGRWNPQG